jgi:hypothetical protein
MPQSQFPVFCSFWVSKKLHRNYSRNWTKQKLKSLITWHEDAVQSRRRTRGWPHQLVAQAPLGRATRGCDRLVHPLASPFRLFNPLDGKTLGPELFSIKHNASRRHHWCEIGRIQKLFPAPYRRGESQPEAFFITMPASGVMCEYSTLDYGSIAVARWISSPPYASCLDLMSFLSWSRSSLCNSTCCVCWDLMNIEYYVKLIYNLSSLCRLWSCMLSVASRYLGRVDASDSKREYLYSIVGSCL